MQYNLYVQRRKVTDDGQRHFVYWVKGGKREGWFKLSVIAEWDECKVGKACLDDRFKTVGKKGGFKTVYQAICASRKQTTKDKSKPTPYSPDFLYFLNVMNRMKPL